MNKAIPTITFCIAALAASAQTHMRIHTAAGTTDIELQKLDSITFITQDPSDPFNGHEYIDLALPSGLLWAKVNIGASTPSQYGNYYSWGETTPKESYTWENYKYAAGSSKTLTKYNTNGSYGVVDGKTELEPMDDAATQNWGGQWRIPTNDEMTELFNAENVTWEWTTMDEVYGYLGKSTRNGATIFLPAAGSKDGTSVNWSSDIAGDSAYGRYWTSSLYTINGVTYDAFYWWFNKSKVNVTGTYRSYSRPVRAVVKPTEK